MLAGLSFYFMMFVVNIMIFVPAGLFWDFFGSGWKIKVIPGLKNWYIDIHRSRS